MWKKILNWIYNKLDNELIVIEIIEKQFEMLQEWIVSE